MPAARANALTRPASAPRLAGGSAASRAADLQASRGFSASLSTHTLRAGKPRPQTATTASLRATTASLRPSSPQKFELRDLPALTSDAVEYESMLGSVGDSVVRDSLQKPPAQQARRKGTQLWVEGHLQRAIQEFSSAVDLEPAGSKAQLEALQLRCSGLLRAGRHEEALTDAQTVIMAMQAAQQAAQAGAPGAAFSAREQMPGSSLGTAGRSTPRSLGSVETAVAAWQLHGMALAGCERHEEAASSFARALGLRPATKHAASLTRQFMDAARAAPKAALPLAVYLPRADDDAAAAVAARHKGERLVPEKPPIYRLLLRPRFPPWPLDLSMQALLGRAAPGGGGGGGKGGGDDDGGTGALTRLSVFCAFQQMPAEPHLCFSCFRPERETLSLLQLRIDGQIQVLSNGSDEAWETAKSALFGHAPNFHGPADFETVASGWVQGGRVGAAFEALVRESHRQRQEGRSRMQRQREEAEKGKRAKQREVHEWLEQLGLGELRPNFDEAGVDLEAMQYLQEDDLLKMGITELGARRKLMAARATRAQYVSMSERITTLEAENERLLAAQVEQQGATARAVQDAADYRDAVRDLRSELEVEREGRLQLKQRYDKQATDLRSERARADVWKAHAEGFFGDSEALSAQLQSLTDGARGDIRSSKVHLEDSLATLIENVGSSYGAGGVGGIGSRPGSAKPRPGSGRPGGRPSHLQRPGSSGSQRSATPAAPAAAPTGGLEAALEGGGASGGAGGAHGASNGGGAAAIGPGSTAQAALG